MVDRINPAHAAHTAGEVSVGQATPNDLVVQPNWADNTQAGISPMTTKPHAFKINTRTTFPASPSRSPFNFDCRTSL